MGFRWATCLSGPAKVFGWTEFLERIDQITQGVKKILLMSTLIILIIVIVANNHNICQGEGLLKDGDGKEAISVFWDPLRKTPRWKQKV